jgi:hypothetical protein
MSKFLKFILLLVYGLKLYAINSQSLTLEYKILSKELERLNFSVSLEFNMISYCDISSFLFTVYFTGSFEKLS